MHCKPIIILMLLFPSIVCGQNHWESVILADQDWKYLPAVSEPPANVMMTGFDDANWMAGPGGIGYDDGDDAFATKLPVIRIDTDGQYIIDDPRIVAHMGIIDNGAGNLNNTDDPFNAYDGRITIEVRGQSSQMFPKKSYRLETQDAAGENLNVSLLGMPAENDWILYAPYSDKSLLRNAVTFELGKYLDPYCSRMAFVELFLNDDYQGIYILMEQIKRDDNRVNIARLEPTENTGDGLTGGYIFKVDKIDPDYVPGIDGFLSSPEPSYPNAKDIIYQYYDPDGDELTPTQRNYLREYIIEAEEVLISSYFDDPEVGYNRYLNTGSFVDFMLMSEISKEVDKYRYSNYFYKKKESKGGEIFAGPIWDFNLGYGNVDYWQEGLITSGWLYDDLQPYEWSMMFWWARLNDDTWFRDLARTRWDHLRKTSFSNANIQAMIDSLTGYIDEAQQRNFQRWPILGTYVWPNYNWQGNTYENEVTYFSNWLFARLAWLDNNFIGNILEPEVMLSESGQSGAKLLFRMDLTEEYFTNRKLRTKYFNLLSGNENMYVDTVYYENAGTATLALGVRPGFTFGGDLTLEVDDRILNGSRSLVTNTITVDVASEHAEMPFGVDIYAAGKRIFISTNDYSHLPEYARVYNTTGQMVGIHTLAPTRLNEIHTNLPQGIYIVTLETFARTGAPVRQKIMIR